MENNELRLPESKLEDIRLVVCDMDGTALNSRKEFSPEMLSALASLKNVGIDYTIASARTPMMLGVFCTQAQIGNLPVVSLEGALVSEWASGKTLFECPMGRETVKEIMEYCSGSGLDYTFYTSRCAYLRRDTKRFWRFKKYNDLASQYGLAHVVTATFEDCSLAEIVNEKVYKIFIDNPSPESIEKLNAFLQSYSHVRTDCSEGHSITIMHESVSKGSALLALLPHLGLDREQVCCFGDWNNDVDMLRYFPNSVAMRNGVLEAKQVAKYVTCSNDENGVAFFIRNYILS